MISWVSNTSYDQGIVIFVVNQWSFIELGYYMRRDWCVRVPSQGLVSGVSDVSDVFAADEKWDGV